MRELLDESVRGGHGPTHNHSAGPSRAALLAEISSLKATLEQRDAEIATLKAAAPLTQRLPLLQRSAPHMHREQRAREALSAVHDAAQIWPGRVDLRCLHGDKSDWSNTTVIVPAVYKEWRGGGPPAWLRVQYPVFLYQRLNQSLPCMCANRGYESAVYFYFIAQHYSQLPAYVAFVQGDWIFQSKTSTLSPTALIGSAAPRVSSPASHATLGSRMQMVGTAFNFGNRGAASMVLACRGTTTCRWASGAPSGRRAVSHGALRGTHGTSVHATLPSSSSACGSCCGCSTHQWPCGPISGRCR